MPINYFSSSFEAHFDANTVESTRKVTFIIASEATGKNHRNRYIYNWDNWYLDNFNSSGVVLYQHQGYGDSFINMSSPDDVIAKATAWVDKFEGKKRLMSEAEFEPRELNESADKVFRKVIFGSLKAASTGIKPYGGKVNVEYVKNERNETVDYFFNFPGQDLLEWSIVHIPADPAAVKRSAQSQFIIDLLGDISMSSAKEVLDAIERKYNDAPIEEIEKELSGPSPNLNKYISKLNQFKK